MPSPLMGRLVAGLYVAGLRVLCKNEGLNYFSSCPSYTDENGDQITMFTLGRRVMRLVFSWPLLEPN